MGNLAGGRRREKGRRAVIPLAAWSGTRRREFARWPERWWENLLHALGAPRTLDAPTRKAIREYIMTVVTRYEEALGKPEPSNEEIADAMKRLRDVVGEAATFGFELRVAQTPDPEKEAALAVQLGFPPPQPPTPQTLRIRMLVLTLAEIFLADIPMLIESSEVSLSVHDLLPRHPLLPGQLAALAERLAPGAWRFRSGPKGYEGRLALEALASRLNQLAVLVSGKPLRFSVYDSAKRAPYGGSLLAVMQLLQPALPRVAGSIAEWSPGTLAARLKAVHAARPRRKVAPIS